MRRVAVGSVALGIALLVLAPVLGRGFVLVYDMVFAHRQWLLPDTVGLGSALPRSVPSDAVVAAVTAVVPGDLVQKVLLVAALFAGPLGAGLLVPVGSVGVRIVAAVTYGWSGYVAERLFIGHWPYLLAYACLPWIARAAVGLRGGLRPPVTSLPADTDSPGEREFGEREIGDCGPDEREVGERHFEECGTDEREFGERGIEDCGSDEREVGERKSSGSREHQFGVREVGDSPAATEPSKRAAPFVRYRRPGRAVAALVVASVPAVLTPSGGLIAAMVGVVGGGRRALGVTIPVALVLNAPWWVPAVLHPAGGLSTSDGAAAFGARGEGWGGAVVSALGLGGIWNAEVVPDSRSHPLVPLLILAITAVAVVGWWEWRRRSPVATGLIALGLLGVLLAALGGTTLFGWVAANVPGGGLLRDSQKWVAWWALPLAIGFALGARAAARTMRRTGALILAGAAILPVAMMPDLAWGGWGRLESVEYPKDWHEVADLLREDPRTGDVVALPLSAFRQFEWNGNRTQYDPAHKALPRTTIVDDTLYVGGKPVAGEDERVAAVRRVVAQRGDLAALGIGWVLVEHGTPGEPIGELTAGMERVYQGEWLDLYRIPGEISQPGHETAPAAAVVAADVIALAIVTLSLLWLVLPAGRLIPSRPRSRE